jgi:hypothetical protein
VKRVLAVALLGVTAAVCSAAPASAATKSPDTKNPNWNQQDTAVYVVSTLNLLRARDGKACTDFLVKRLKVTQYDVYADQTVQNMYFVVLRRADGSAADTFAYQLGWAKPRDLGSRAVKFGAHRASLQIAQEFRSDPKQLIGSFTSTLPT